MMVLALPVIVAKPATAVPLKVSVPPFESVIVEELPEEPSIKESVLALPVIAAFPADAEPCKTKNDPPVRVNVPEPAVVVSAKPNEQPVPAVTIALPPVELLAKFKLLAPLRAKVEEPALAVPERYMVDELFNV
jgi:hypothetical protein